MLHRENIVWVLTRLNNASDDTNSEFATEMAKMDSGDWKINGLAFNQLLTALAAKAGAGGTAYAPMVQNPQGGESLVIYFDFDNSAVSSRSNRQGPARASQDFQEGILGGHVQDRREINP